MNGFSAEWLTLREPIDHAARNKTVLDAVGDYLSKMVVPKVTDIACGTGSTIRGMEPFVEKEIAWTLVDHDPLLLKEAERHTRSKKATLKTFDLNVELEEAINVDADLISTSAFLDLVSEDWLQVMVATLKRKSKPFYAALSYDGRAGLTPFHISDELVLKGFNAHQKTDKGFGPALGPNAAMTAIDLFEEAGFRVTEGQSDWVAGVDHPDFQGMLLEGWSDAASEIMPDQRDAFDSWFDERKSQISKGELTNVFVGHVDFLAVPG